MNNEVILNLNETDKAKRFTMVACKFNSDVDVIRDRYTIDAKSALGIFTLDLSRPVLVRLNSDDMAEITRFNEMMEEFK